MDKKFWNKKLALDIKKDKNYIQIEVIIKI